MEMEEVRRDLSWVAKDGISNWITNALTKPSNQHKILPSHLSTFDQSSESICFNFTTSSCRTVMRWLTWETFLSIRKVSDSSLSSDVPVLLRLRSDSHSDSRWCCRLAEVRFCPHPFGQPRKGEHINVRKGYHKGSSYRLCICWCDHYAETEVCADYNLGSVLHYVSLQ